MLMQFSATSFVAGVMVGLVIGGAWYLRGNLGLTSDALAIPVAKTSPSTPASDAVEVVRQRAGRSVVISSVTVPPPGVWVAVRELEGQTLGKVLGATRVGGPRGEVVIDLLRATEPDLTYAVQLYRDDALGAFDPGENSVYVDFDTGQPVVVYFRTAE